MTILLHLILLWAMLTPAQPEPTTTPEFERRSQAAIEAGAYDEAIGLLSRQIELQPGSFVPEYNLACAHALNGQVDLAQEHLFLAVQKGFDDLRQMRRDPHLAPVRELEVFDRLVEAWPDVLDARLTANLGGVRRWLDGEYLERRVEPRRLVALSAHDTQTTEATLDELRAIESWARTNIFGEVSHEDAALDPWVILVLPTPKDFQQWSIATLGAAGSHAFARVGGAYMHDQKRLVAMDLGPTLRHEFIHIIHWRDMTRLGQRHPIWIQEGLGALLEDWDPARDGIRPAPSWRDNITKRRLGTGRLPSVSVLAELDQAQFSSSRPLAKYAHARSVFLYMMHTGKLRAWYEAYTASFEDDPTGIAALEGVTGLSTEEFDDRFRDWIRALPETPETGTDLEATLGIQIEEGEGDGPVVVGLDAEARRRTGLRLLDRITAIDGAPTRGLQELIRRLAHAVPGQSVTLGVRRGRTHLELPATLEARD